MPLSTIGTSGTGECLVPESFECFSVALHSNRWKRPVVNIEEQIIHREQREKLLRQIETLEKRARSEKQTRKKYELHQQIMKLKKELAE